MLRSKRLGTTVLALVTMLIASGRGSDASGPALSAASAHTFTHTWNGAEVTRTYNLVAPSTSCAPQGMVVVLQPDGSGEDGGLGALADRMCIFVVSPVATGDWQAFHEDGDPEDVEFIAALIQSLQTSYSIPADNVLITGFSFGGSMAYRVLCERSDVVTGIVAMGQTFLEPASGQVKKDQAVDGQITTETALDMMAAARQAGNGCDPEFKRPHYAVVGTADFYYGEDGGIYDGRALWERMSTTVLGCTGNPTEGDGARVTRDASTYFEYASCELSPASLNRYLSVEGRGHSPTDWNTTIWAAFEDFFQVTGPAPEADPADSLHKTDSEGGWEDKN